MMTSVAYVSRKIENHSNKYPSFYRYQYNKEMIAHSLSTVGFLFKTQGLFGFFKIIYKRIDEVFSMVKWSVTDRSKVQSDIDALKVKNKVSENEFIKMNE